MMKESDNHTGIHYYVYKEAKIIACPLDELIDKQTYTILL